MTTATFRRDRFSSDATACQNDGKRAQEDRQIETERPVVQVSEIVAQLDLGLGGVLAGNLRESRQTGSRGVPQRPSGHRRREALGELGTLGPWSDQAHVSPQDVPELRDLVDARGAEAASDRRDAR